MKQQYTTDLYQGMLAETVTVRGSKGDVINAYFARPLGEGPFPGVVLIHHAPGWDEIYKEFTRKFAYHGYLSICPNIYFRFGHGSPDEVATKVRLAGGVADDEVIGDVQGCIDYLRSLPICSGKIGVIGSCSGGRHTYLVACRGKGVDAAVDLWGGRVVMSKEELSPKTPVAPIEYTKDLSWKKTSLPRRNRWLSRKRNSRNTIRITSSTCIRKPVTVSSTTTGAPTGRSRRSTDGRKSLPSSKSIFLHSLGQLHYCMVKDRIVLYGNRRELSNL
jgi:dienelactone hydrolase